MKKPTSVINKRTSLLPSVLGTQTRGPHGKRGALHHRCPLGCGGPTSPTPLRQPLGSGRCPATPVALSTAPLWLHPWVHPSLPQPTYPRHGFGSAAITAGSLPWLPAAKGPPRAPRGRVPLAGAQPGSFCSMTARAGPQSGGARARKTELVQGAQPSPSPSPAASQQLQRRGDGGRAALTTWQRAKLFHSVARHIFHRGVLLLALLLASPELFVLLRDQPLFPNSPPQTHTQKE